MPITVRQALLSEIFQVRWEVLRPNRPREVAEFPGDEAPETIHAGAFDHTGMNIACATLTRVDWKPIDPLGEHTAPQPAWQLRGMGVIPAHQGTGVGQSLLATLESDETLKGITVSKGDELIVLEVDPQRNVCRVTRELT